MSADFPSEPPLYARRHVRYADLCDQQLRHFRHVYPMQECVALCIRAVAHPKVFSTILMLIANFSVDLRRSFMVDTTPAPSVRPTSLCHSGKLRENISIVSWCISCTEIVGRGHNSVLRLSLFVHSWRCTADPRTRALTSTQKSG